jgi:hypothetical protein
VARRGCFPLRQGNQIGAGVGHGRAARFREQTDIMAGYAMGQQAIQCIGLGVLIQFFKLQFLQELSVPAAFRKARAVLACSTTK